MATECRSAARAVEVRCTWLGFGFGFGFGLGWLPLTSAVEVRCTEPKLCRSMMTSRCGPRRAACLGSGFGFGFGLGFGLGLGLGLG